MLYFIQTTHFIPINFKEFGFKVIDDNTIVLKKDESVWKSINLYDLGWGREKGFYRTPMPKKEELILMAFPKTFKNDSEERFNYWGSISVLLDNYCDFLLEKIYNGLRDNTIMIDKYETALTYINSELNISDNIINRLADKQLASNCKTWKKINKEFDIVK